MGLRPQHPQSERPLTAMTDDDLPIKPATRLVQAGRRAEWTKGVVNVPVWRGSTVLYDNVAHMRATGAGDLHEKLFYGRKGLPTQWSLADALTSLEPGAQATFLYPSGVAAIAAALLSVLSPGDELLLVDSAYDPTRGSRPGYWRGWGSRRASTIRWSGRNRRVDRPGDPRDLPRKPRLAQLRGAGHSRHRRGRQGAWYHDDPRQYLGDAALLPGDREGHRPDGAGLHQICRRPFGRDAGIGHRRALALGGASRHQLPAGRSPAPTTPIWAAGACAPWASASPTIRRAR